MEITLRATSIPEAGGEYNTDEEKKEEGCEEGELSYDNATRSTPMKINTMAYADISEEGALLHREDGGEDESPVNYTGT